MRRSKKIQWAARGGFIVCLALSTWLQGTVADVRHFVFSPLCEYHRPAWLNAMLSPTRLPSERNKAFLSADTASHVLQEEGLPSILRSVPTDRLCMHLWWPQTSSFVTHVQYSLIVLLAFLVIPLTLLQAAGFLIGGCVKTTEASEDLTESSRLQQRGPPIIFRAVTKGEQAGLIAHTCEVNAKIITKAVKSGLLQNGDLEHGTEWRYELISALEVDLKKCRRVSKLVAKGSFRQLVIPRSFQCPLGSLYKARALYWASLPDVSPCVDETLIVHMDEETELTLESIQGILDFGGAHGSTRIGQGLIVFGGHRSQQSLWLTLADSIRVGDEFVRGGFVLGHGSLLMGFQGSFVVIPAGIQRDVSWDHGPRSSITEDLNFSLEAASRGYKSALVDGSMLECSCFTLSDFFHQRARWMRGVINAAVYLRLPARYLVSPRYLLFTFGAIFLCTLSAALLTIFAPPPSTIFTCIVASVTSATCRWVFIFGCYLNFAESRRSCLTRLSYLVLIAFVFPAMMALEGLAMFSTFVLPNKGFHVVDKESGEESSINSSTEDCAQDEGKEESGLSTPLSTDPGSPIGYASSRSHFSPKLNQ